MREELIRVLNSKLEDINNDIASLTDLNQKIDVEEEKSGFIAKLLETFSDNNDVMNFVKIEKEDFDRALNITGEDVKNVFNTDSCNYEGLVYLINGINSGISLSLTDDQKNGIKYLIDNLNQRKNETDAAVDGYMLVKSQYEISDLDELNDKKVKFEKTLNDVNNNSYVKDIDLLKEAISFSNLSSEDTINLLTYVLEYNSDLYKEGKMVNEEKDEEPLEEIAVPPVEEKVPEIEKTTEFDGEFHFNDIENDKLFDLPNITFDDEVKEETNNEIDNIENTPPVEEGLEYQEFSPATEETVEEKPVDVEVNIDAPEYIPVTEEMVSHPVEEAPKEEPMVEVEIPSVVKEEDATIPSVEEKVEIDSDFKDVIDEKADYDNEVEISREDEKTSTRELQKIFSKYGVEENVVLNELIDGNVDEYQNTLDEMKSKGILDSIKVNKELLIEILLYSNTDVIDKVLKIVKEDLSVDDEDYGITLKIVINTIPSIFIKDGGNYENFVKNVELFKDLEINLINLFDFSKEIFVADNEVLRTNLDTVNKYGFDITYKNAKYLLLIPHIADKLDYYIESVYEDKQKKETFDGIKYIKDYAAKLNVVTDETIKRLRYASENGKKVFGSKPGSLSGEITNLKVNALDINSDYLSKFFDNKFSTLTADETREYVKLIHNSTNVGDYSDELDKLNSYRNGLRYNFDGIIVSYNKVVRNYSILRSYGIDAKKALQFAVCYNLVITKDEYDKLNNLLEKIGGNV